MKQNGDIYEYIYLYAGDLAIILSYPNSLMHALYNVYKLKINGLLLI